MDKWDVVYPYHEIPSSKENEPMAAKARGNTDAPSESRADTVIVRARWQD